MKIYFNSALHGKDKYEKNFKIIIELMEKMNHEVIKSHILDRNLNDVIDQTKKDQREDNLRARRAISECDVMVVEGSSRSMGVGYLLSVGLEMKKPILVLFSNNTHGIIAGDSNRLSTVRRYNLRDGNLKSILRKFLASAQEKIEITRFNFQLSKYMDNFLTEEALENSISKADFLRNLIRESMDKML